MLKYVCFASLIWLTASSCTSAQSAERTWTFAAFNSDLMRLTFRFAPSSPEQTALAASLKSLQTIRASFTAAYGPGADTEMTIAAKMPALYSETMLENIRAIKALPAARDARLAVLEAVRTDLEDKAKLPSETAGMTHRFPATVTVHLTLAIIPPSHAIPALVNLHVNSCLRGTSDAGQTFGSEEKGTLVTRPPGCICVWAETAGQRLTEPSVTRDLGPTGPDVPIVVPVQR